ncbi:hypothetical protein ACHAXA_011470 [Cyclostephanos tholiformis]|uniref:Gamma-soluble NSF attachment protein n=1 Tax=Cyclostephanos tholiformis TaxID=382380 RepID=A0ABD3SE90_9STRA
MAHHYKRDASANRNALFGGMNRGGIGSGGSSSSSSSSSSATPSSSSSRPRPPIPPSSSSSSSPSRPRSSSSSSSSPNVPSTATSSSSTTTTQGPSAIFAPSGRSAASSVPPPSILSGSAKVSKLAEAENYRLLASKSMTRGVFSRPDPISASNYYRRAADAYARCGEYRLEKLVRIASGDCQDGLGAHATAAVEYARAAELVEMTMMDGGGGGGGGGTGSGGGGRRENDDDLVKRRRECRKLYADAARMYELMGERGRCAEMTMKSSFAMIMGTNVNEKLDARALTCIEAAIETFVGDPLNDKRDYRRTGTSRYVDVDASATTGRGGWGTTIIELAKNNVVLDSYAHEYLIRAGNDLVRRKMYESALYAYGAVTAMLKLEGYATVSLYRSYVSECVITLAMGDVVAARNDYERVHLQDITGYLTSRECALEEDLIRACDDMDVEALEGARGKSGPNRGALANLDPIIRELVGEIRVTGRAAKGGGGRGGGSGSKDEKAKDGTTATRGGGIGRVEAASTRDGTRGPTSDGAYVTSSDDHDPGGGVASVVPRASSVDADLERDTDAYFEEMDDIMNKMGLNDDDDDDSGGDDDEIDLR